MSNPGYELFLTLNSVELSDHSRTYSEGRDERSKEIQLANGHTRKYIKFVAKTWNLSWDWLPNLNTLTVDGRAGRDSLKTITSSGASRAFSVRSVDSSVASYTVFVVEYNEELIRRDYVTGASFWKVSMSLKEV